MSGPIAQQLKASILSVGVAAGGIIAIELTRLDDWLKFLIAIATLAVLGIRGWLAFEKALAARRNRLANKPVNMDDA